MDAPVTRHTPPQRLFCPPADKHEGEDVFFKISSPLTFSAPTQRETKSLWRSYKKIKNWKRPPTSVIMLRLKCYHD